MVAISIIIPVYNVARYIEECLESVKAQTFQNFELILVEDCSTDSSKEISTNWLVSNNLPFKWQLIEHPENRGLGSARNSGMAAARGQYIAFLDSDDRLAPDYLATLLQAAEYYQADITCCNYTCLHEGGRLFIPLMYRGDCPKLMSGEEALRGLFQDGIPFEQVWGKLFSRHFIMTRSLKFIEALNIEDVPFSLLAFPAASYVVQLPYGGYFYRIRKGSTMSSNSTKNIEDKLIALRQLGISTSEIAGKAWYFYRYKQSLLLLIFSCKNLNRTQFSDYMRQLGRITLPNEALEPGKLLRLIQKMPIPLVFVIYKLHVLPIVQQLRLWVKKYLRIFFSTR